MSFNFLFSVIFVLLCLSCSSEPRSRADFVVSPFVSDTEPLYGEQLEFAALCVDVADKETARVVLGRVRTSDRHFIPIRYLNGPCRIEMCVEKIVAHSTKNPAYYTPVLLTYQSFSRKQLDFDLTHQTIHKAALLKEQSQTSLENFDTFKACFKPQLLKQVPRVTWLEEIGDYRWEMHVSIRE